ncbi:MAG: FHA domain-containing protein [Anaerolineales bacterium]|nr:FHA domain-containing protein [Anaerolineales bacterium]
MAGALLLGAVAQVHGQTDSRPVFVITGVDVTSFPDIQVTAFGANLGGELASLPAVLKEDGVEQPIVASEPATVGVATAFLLDASSNIRDPGNTGDARNVEIAKAVNRFVEMQELSAATDWLAAYTVNGAGDGFSQIADWTQDHQAVANELSLYAPEALPDSTPLFGLIKYGLDQIELAPVPQNLRRSLVVFSDGFDALSAVQIDDIVNRANRLGVTIHTVMVGPEAEARRQNLQRIADVTDGQYLVYSSLQDMEGLGSHLASEREQQRYLYRLTQAEPKTVEVAVTTPGGRTLRDEAAFPTVPAQPATMTIQQPSSGSRIERSGATPDTPIGELTPASLTIVLDVQWPDGHPRTFDRIEYELNGKTEATTAEPFTSIEFPIADLDAGNYTLRALAIDELGIESRAAPVSFAVNVSLPAPAPATEASAAPAADTSANDTGANDTGATPAIAEAVGESNAPANTAASSPTEIVLLPDGADTLQGSTWRIPIANIDVAYGSTASGERQLRIGDSTIPLIPAIAMISLIPLAAVLAALYFVRRRNGNELARGEPLPIYAGVTGENISTVVDATAYDLTEDATEAQPIVDFEAPASLHYVEGGDSLPKKLNIEGGREVRIGRKAAFCDLIIDDQRVSRLHASIQENETMATSTSKMKVALAAHLSIGVSCASTTAGSWSTATSSTSIPWLIGLNLRSLRRQARHDMRLIYTIFVQ